MKRLLLMGAAAIMAATSVLAQGQVNTANVGLGLITINDSVKGVQMSPVSNIAENAQGVQLSAFSNVAY